MHTVLNTTWKGGAGKSALAAHFGALAERPGRAACGVDAACTAGIRLARTFSSQL